MKIRQGFVSNSSTTSFCIYGTWLNGNEVGEDVDIYDTAENHDLECHHMDYSGYAVGLSPCNMRDEETLAQFRRRVGDQIFKAFGIDDAHELDWIEESFYG
jgi:hypothetical protein